MEIKKLQALVIDALEDVKAQDIKIFDTAHLTSLFDRIAVVSGTSNRQTKALAASVRDRVKGNGGRVLSIEGEDTGEWVLVDLGDMIVHIMQPAIRAYYRLEEIWGEKEIKLGAAKRISSRATSETDDTLKKPVGRHLTTNQSDSGDPAPAKPARKTKAASESSDTDATTLVKAAIKPARKSAARQPAGKTVKVAKTKTAVVSAKTAAAKKVPVKRAVVKKTTVKSSA
jgi:ribosome-associated protein